MIVLSAIQNRPWLELVVDGKPALVDTKFRLLQLGVAVLLDPGLAEPHWKQATAVVVTPDADVPDFTQTIKGGTNDPVVVALARRYYDAKNSEETDFQLGRVDVPSVEEAILELRKPWQRPVGVG